MTDRYPGYDVLQKRHTPSWNAITRRVVDARLNVPREPRFFSAEQWQTLAAVCARILPQPAGRDPVPLPAYVDAKLFERAYDGYRLPGMPEQGEAWRRGLAALDEVAAREHGARFHALAPETQDALLRRMQDGAFDSPALAGMPAQTFFDDRVIHDIVDAYYAHPTAWNEIGWGGPASPRGYVRLKMGMRDPWEPAEAEPGAEDDARRINRRVG